MFSNLILESRVKTKKLSTKSRSYCGPAGSKAANTNVTPLQSYNMNAVEPMKPIEKYTVFEKFLLASTPYVTQLSEADTLNGIFKSIETVADLGVEILYTSPEDGTNCWDIYLPTLKGISCAYKTPNNEDLQTCSYTEDEPLYNRDTFVDKLEDLAETTCDDLFKVPIMCITNTSWVAIEWFLHYSTKDKGAQKSIIIYYGLNLLRGNSYLPVLNWEVSDTSDPFLCAYTIPAFPYPGYQPFDVNTLVYK